MDRCGMLPKMRLLASLILLSLWAYAAHATPAYKKGYPEQLAICSSPETLQACLDQNVEVRLLNIDYSLRGPHRLLLKTGQQIYGLTRTTVPPIVMAPGSSDVAISHVGTSAITFLPGQRYFENLFYDIRGAILASQAHLENNVFARVDGQILIDDSTSGSARQNIFIACHANSISPSLILKGSPLIDSSYNDFLALILQGQVGSGAVITHQDHILMIGVEAENWNHLFRDQKWQAAVDVEQSRDVDVMGSDFGSANDFATPFMSYSGEGSIHVSNINGYVQRTGSLASSLGGSPWSIDDLNSIHIKGHPRLTGDHLGIPIKLNGNTITAPASNDPVVRLEVSDADLLNFEKARWLQGSIPSVQDTLANNKAAHLLTDIQHAIDTSADHIAILPPGTFRISKPLTIPVGGGLIGSGSGRTTIIGSGTQSIVVFHLNSNDTSLQSRFILANIALSNAKVGVRVSGEYVGAPHIVVQAPILSDVRIENMSEAGILVDGIQGWDNVMMDNMVFEEDRVGILQSYRAGRAVDDGLLNYVDKTACIFCSFVKVGYGIELLAGRQDNQDSCMFCAFSNYYKAAVSLNNNSDYILLLPVFRDGGPRSVEVRSHGQSSSSTRPSLIQYPHSNDLTSTIRITSSIEPLAPKPDIAHP